MSTAFGALRKMSLSLRASGLTILSFSSPDRRGRYRMTQGSLATREGQRIPRMRQLCPNFGELRKGKVRRILLPRGWVNHTPTSATLVRLVFPLASFHPVVLIDVADVEPASTAHCVARLPVAGAVQYVIVGTAVERVGGSFPQSSSRPSPPRIVSAPDPL